MICSIRATARNMCGCTAGAWVVALGLVAVGTVLYLSRETRGPVPDMRFGMLDCEIPNTAGVRGFAISPDRLRVHEQRPISG
jgi:hypothetical protein